MQLHSIWLVLLAVYSANGRVFDAHAPATKRGEDAGTTAIPAVSRKRVADTIVHGTENTDEKQFVGLCRLGCATKTLITA